MRKALLLMSSLLAFAPTTMVLAEQTNEEKLTELKQQIESLQAEYDKLAGETGTPQEGAGDNKDWGKRSNPVPLGKSVEISETAYSGEKKFTAKYMLGATAVIRGDEAYKIVKEHNEFNNEAPEGFEWIVIDMKLEYLEGDDDEPFHTPSHFKVFDSKGKEVKTVEYASLKDDAEFQYVEIFPGTTHEGKLALVVPKDDDCLLVYDTFEQKIFFSVKQATP